MSHPSNDPGAPEPQPEDRGFNAKSLIYAAIPIGFIVLVVVLFLGGEAAQETTEGSPVESIEEQVD